MTNNYIIINVGEKYKNKYNYNIVFNKLIWCITLYHTYHLLYHIWHIGMTSNHSVINVGEKNIRTNKITVLYSINL